MGISPVECSAALRTPGTEAASPQRFRCPAPRPEIKSPTFDVARRGRALFAELQERQRVTAFASTCWPPCCSAGRNATVVASAAMVAREDERGWTAQLTVDDEVVDLLPRMRRAGIRER